MGSDRSLFADDDRIGVMLIVVKLGNIGRHSEAVRFAGNDYFVGIYFRRKLCCGEDERAGWNKVWNRHRSLIYCNTFFDIVANQWGGFICREPVGRAGQLSGNGLFRRFVGPEEKEVKKT